MQKKVFLCKLVRRRLDINPTTSCRMKRNVAKAAKNIHRPDVSKFALCLGSVTINNVTIRLQLLEYFFAKHNLSLMTYSKILKEIKINLNKKSYSFPTKACSARGTKREM